MKKCIMMVFVCCTCLLVAQDIAGTYRATGQRVEYQFYTRPNVEGSTTYDQSGTVLDDGTSDGSTTLSIHDAYGLGVNVPIANIPVGYNFAEIVNGPLGITAMNAMQYFLYVTFGEDGNAVIANSQVLASDTEDCETEITLLPLDDEFVYTSNLNAGVPVQPNMVTGQPNASPYVGQAAGTWSVDGSSFFSFFPATPTPVMSDRLLYTEEGATCYYTCLAMGGTNEVCGYDCMMAGEAISFEGVPHPGATAGYIINAPAESFMGAANNVTPDLHIEWHYIDGEVAETGLGDILPDDPESCVEGDTSEDCTDEDNDGTVYDNILGYPEVEVTNMSSACGFDYPILGDVGPVLAGIPMDANQDGVIDADDCAGFDVDDEGNPVCIPAFSMADACISSDDAGNYLDEANDFYLMDAALAPWSGFMTFNAAMYQATGVSSYLIDDSASDFDALNDFGFVDALTGAPCNPADGSPTCAPYSANGGRLVMTFDPTCIPVITSISVLGELTEVGCGEASGGDVTEDGNVDVLDVVQVVSYVLGNSDTIVCADVNADGAVNVQDVVVIVASILGNRGEEATSATFTKVEDGMLMTANGIVGAVQLTLSHGSDFNFELTSDAFVADFNTDGSTTTIIVVNPGSERLFSSTGDYTIEEVIAATTAGYINTGEIVPTAIAIGNAYPNPFNPSTSFELNVGQAGNVSVMVYNVNGQFVDMIQEGPMDAGLYNMTWNANDFSSGMYIIKANNADVTVSQKVMLVK